MQAWLTEYDNENLTDVKDYFKNYYEDMYKLVMTPLQTQYQQMNTNYYKQNMYDTF